MQVVHHIRLGSHSEQERAALEEAGVKVKKGPMYLEITEDDPRWIKVAVLAEKLGLRDVVTTEYSAADRAAAKHLRLQVTAEEGYPEPALDGSYRSATYDLADYCKVCGIGQRQIAPFRMKKAPALARSFLRLIWIIDECFVNVHVWRDVFEPLGVGSRPVVLNRTGAIIDSVVQLEIPRIVDLRVDGLPHTVCSRCGRIKFVPRVLREGPCPEPADTDAPLFKSSQYFGEGAQAFRLILVSSSLYETIHAAGLKGAEFIPCFRGL